jgi:hypothetical protein
MGIENPIPPPPPAPGVPLPTGGATWQASAPQYPAYAPGVSSQPGPRTVEGVRRVRNGISLYKYVVLLTIVASAILVFSMAFSIGTSALSVSSSGNSASAGRALNNSSAVISSVASIAGLAGIVSLVLMVVAWLRWRDGTNAVYSASGEYGPEHQNMARAAKRHYDYTVYAFLSIILAAIIGAVAIVSIVFRLYSVESSSTVMTTQETALILELLVGIILLAVVVLMLNFLMYYFSSNSLKESILALTDTRERGNLDSARTYVLVGAAIYFIPVLGGVLIFIGMYKFEKCYDAWLANPPAAGGFVATSGPFF